MVVVEYVKKGSGLEIDMASDCLDYFWTYFRGHIAYLWIVNLMPDHEIFSGEKKLEDSWAVELG